MIDLRDVFRVYQRFPSGRMLYATTRMKAAVTPEDGPEIPAALDATIDAARAVRRAEMARRALAKRPTFGPVAVSLDHDIDRVVNGIANVATTYQDALGPDTELGAAAQRVVQAVFPRGVREVTGLPYVEEATTVADLLARLSPDGDLAQEAQLLHLQPLVQQAQDILARFQRELDARPSGVSWAQIQDLRATAHQRLLEVVARIVGRYPTPADAEARTRLLSPLWAQQQVLNDSYRRRRGLVDVDPETGTPQIPDVEDIPQPPVVDPTITPDDQPDA